MAIVLDNNKIGAIGEYIKNYTDIGSKLTIVSPIFTIYVFEELRQVLEKSGKFKFLFNEPTFIKRIVANDKEVKEFELQMHQREKNVYEFNLEIGLKNNLDQNQIASKCYNFINEKGEIKSVVKPECVIPNNILIENKDKLELNEDLSEILKLIEKKIVNYNKTTSDVILRRSPEYFFIDNIEIILNNKYYDKIYCKKVIFNEK